MSILSGKWHDLTWPRKGLKFNLHHLRGILVAFKMAVLTPKSGIKRIEKQVRKSNIIDSDLTTTLLNKFQKELAKLRKEGKFDNKTYYDPSDAIPARLYGV